jgi:hypothetical protein
MPKISVIVPLYNKACYIDRCLDSILGQSFPDFEVIVVNDGSTDGSETMVERRRHTRVRLVSQENAGPGAARNHGVRLAQSPLVAFLDGDDAWSEDYLKESVQWMDRAGPDVASLTWGMKINPRSESTERRWKELGIPAGVFRATPATPAKIIIAMLANMLPSSTVMRKSIFDELGGYYARYRCVYSEDAYLYLKLLLKYSAAFDHRPLTIRFEDASELANNLKGVRPIEPFLVDPEGLERDCPEPMRPLLREVLARRALKTASVYGYWGEARQSRGIVRRFVSPEDWRLPYFFTAMAGCTPLGGWAGWLARTATRVKG